MADNYAPKTSKKPQTVGDEKAKQEERRKQKSFADTEYRSSLEGHLRRNPIARLGFDPDRHKVVKDPKTASYLRKGGKTLSKRLDRDVEDTDLLLGEGMSQNPVISHEFTHRGLDILRKKYEKNPEGFVKEYGEMAARMLTDMDYDETLTEFFDKHEEEIHHPNPKVKDMGGTIQDVPTAAIDIFREEILDKHPEDRWGHNEDQWSGQVGLMRAAEDILREQGEVPPVEGEYPGFFEKLGKRLGFAKGGLARMDEEMKALTAEGDVDPVSGNEIPVGGTAEGVRDDVQANLSEGEYVVPAHVVSYLGVKFFDDLQKQAEMGLQKMDEQGQIGGEPDQMEMDLGEEDLEGEVRAFAEGGMVQDVEGLVTKVKNAVSANPTLRSDLNRLGVNFAEGGLVKEWNPDDWANPGLYGGGGGTFFDAPMDKEEQQYKTYVNDQGQTVQILYKNGEPAEAIPEGYYLQGSEGSESWIEKKRRENMANQHDESDASAEERRAINPDHNYFNMSPEELAKVGQVPNAFDEKGINKATGMVQELLGGNVAGLLAGGLQKGVIGGMVQANNLASTMAAAKVAEARGLTDVASHLNQRAEKLSGGVSPFSKMLAGDGTTVYEMHLNDYNNYDRENQRSEFGSGVDMLSSSPVSRPPGSRTDPLSSTSRSSGVRGIGSRDSGPSNIGSGFRGSGASLGFGRGIGSVSDHDGGDSSNQFGGGRTSMGGSMGQTTGSYSSPTTQSRGGSPGSSNVSFGGSFGSADPRSTSGQGLDMGSTDPVDNSNTTSGGLDMGSYRKGGYVKKRAKKK